MYHLPSPARIRHVVMCNMGCAASSLSLQIYFDEPLLIVLTVFKGFLVLAVTFVTGRAERPGKKIQSTQN